MAMGESTSTAVQASRHRLVQRVASQRFPLLPLLGSQIHRGTFSFNTGSLGWTWLGDWLLPFRGEAYFVRELDAWVGLSAHKIEDIVMCEVISPDVRRIGPPAVTYCFLDSPR
jgi:hypothetical protein